MGGGLMQLVAYGAQDVYLTSNPVITFFKVVYRRHTNFAMESIQQDFNGSAKLGGRATCTISRNGDLITNTYLQVKLKGTAMSNRCNSFGHAILKSIELEIGGQRIDKHYSDWLEIWSELTVPEEKRAGYKRMVAKYDIDPEINDVFAANSSTPPTEADRTLYVPLQFFFCRNPGLALPLIALQYHETKINIEFASASEVYTTVPANYEFEECKLFVDYIYLDTDERRRFAQVSHEMLIEQLQYTGAEAVNASGGSQYKYRMNFNHPVKELIWVVKPDGDSNGVFGRYASVESTSSGTDSFDPINPTTGGTVVDTFKEGKIMLNGHDRFTDRPASYFRLVQPYQHHTRVPAKSIYVYSFALRPEEHQPSGTCNFSRIDNAQLSLTMESGKTIKDGKIMVFAVNYNILRIMSGMGGLAFSN